MKYSIPENLIDDIRTRANIVDVVSEFVLLKKSGKNHKGLCPFHSEKTPSFTVSEEKQIFHCFGCGTGGNVFKFLMEREQISFVEAVRKLAARYHVTLPAAGQPSGASSGHSEREKIWQLNRKAREYFTSRLRDPVQGQAARAYLEQRGFDDELIATYELGWALPDWRGLLQTLERKGLNKDRLEQFGLVVKKESRKSGDEVYYDRFRGRVIFPIHDSHGNVIGFAGRVIGEEEPKYLNTPETLVYKKGHNLFGLHRAKAAIRREDRVLIMEGYFDQMRAWQNGFQNAVATCGTALTAQQAALLKQFTRNVVLVFDSDNAGRAAAEKAYEVLSQQGLKVFVAALPPGHDPDSFIREKGGEAFQRLIQDARPFIAYCADRLAAAGVARDATRKIDAINHLLPWLAKTKNQVERSEYVRYIADRLEIEDRALLEEIKKSLAQNRSRVERPSPQGTPARSLDWYLLHLLLADSRGAEDIRRQVPLEGFLEPACRETARMVYEALDRGEELRIDRLLDRTDRPEVKSVLTRLAVAPLEFDNLPKAVLDCVSEVQKRSLQAQINDLKKQRNDAEARGELERSRELHNALRQLQLSLIPQ